MSEPKIAQKSPFVIEVQPGTVAWCACGHSANQPFCDGSHARENTGLSPMIVKIEETGQKKAFCGCKQTSNPPFCDGTHAKL